MKKRYQFDWKVLSIGIFLIIFGTLLYKRAPPKISFEDELLVKCEKLIFSHTSEELKGIEPRFTIIGGGTYSHKQRLVFWQNDEFDVNIQCAASKRNEFDEILIYSFIVNGEDLTNLVKREERN